MLKLKQLFRLKTVSLTLAAALLGSSTIIPQSEANAASIATVSVDASVSQGELFRSEKYFNISKYFTYAGQRDADVQFINDQGLHSKVLRTWVDQDIYDLDTDTYHFSKYDDYFSDTSNMADALLVNIKAEKVIPEYKSPDKVKPVLKNIIKYLKQNYPKVKYIEALNEPDDTHTDRYKGVVTPDTVYSYYKAFSDAVFEVNAELNPSVPLQVGGPTTMRLDIDWLRGFLDGYKNDPSPKKQLDFISYHGYFVGPNFTGFVKEDPSLVNSQRSQIDAELSSRGLSTDIPSFITETGIYPGPLGDVSNSSGGVGPDQLRQAAGLASLHYWFMNNSKNHAFQWELRHPDNARKDVLVSRDPNNVVLPDIPTNKFTPYGNMLVMLSKMKTTRVSAISDSIMGGKGVYALAAKDDTGVSLMVWNYQGTGTTDYNAAVNVSNLPSIFNGKNVRVKTYQIDATTSNYYANPDKANLQMVDDKIMTHNGNYTASVQLEPNSLQLLVLEPVSKSSNAAVSVDANVSQGELFRSEKYFNIAKQSTFPAAQASRAADIQFLGEQGLRTKIQRAWVNESEIYDEATGLFNKYDQIDTYLSQVSNMADELLINLRAEKVVKELEYTPAQIKPVVKEYIKHLKQNFPKIKYIEVLNEPDAPANSDANYYRIDPVTGKQTNTNILSPGNLYSYYKAFSDAVYEVNAELNPAVPLQVGGPALYNFDLDWFRGFLDGYKNDTSPTKKLDFISYHGYLRKDPATGKNLFYKDNPRLATEERSAIETELSSRGISTDIPSFITETGMYPGPLGDDLDLGSLATGKPPKYDYIDKDQLRQAAGMASLAYWYSDSSGKNYPFGWNTRHNGGNGRKDALVTRDRNNKLLDPIYSDKFTPYGNLRKMQSMMKTTKVSASSNSIDSNGKGVYALAAKDDTGVSLMVWNYQGTGTADFNTGVQVSNLPPVFSGKNVRIKTYKINNTTSNYYNGDPVNPNLQMVEDKIVTHNGSYRSSIYLEPNCLQLLVLEPVDTNVMLRNTFDEEVTGAFPGWTVTKAVYTAVSIVNVPSTVNRSVYLKDDSTAGFAQISKTFPAHMETLTVQWRFKEDSNVTGDRFQLKSGTTVAADVYADDAGRLAANGTVIQGIHPGTWYDVSLTANPATDKYDIYINNTLKASGLPLSAPVTSLDTISFRTGEANKNVLYIDDVTISDIIPPSWASGKALAATSRSQSSIGLAWSGADNTAAAYRIFNGAALSATVVGATYATVGGLTPGKDYTFTVQAVDAYGNASTDGPSLNVSTTSSRRGGSSGSVSSGGGPSPGESVSSAGLTADAEGMVDSDSLKSALSASNLVEVAANGDSVSLPAAGLIDASKNLSSAVKINSANGSIVLPLFVLKLEELAQSIGANISELSVSVSIKKVSGDSAKEVAEAVSKANAAPLSDAVDFSVTVRDKGGNSFAVDFGATYVSRSLDVLKAVDPAKTTGALFNESDKSLTFVPTTFEAKDGKTIATLKRNGSSIYTVVELNKSFDDIAVHWARADIELLANKLVIDGVSEHKFDADRSITRAEFAALIVRALGLSPMKSSASIADVKADAWYSDAVSTASAAGIIHGYENGTFRPEAQITREELAAMVVRAMNYAGKSSSVTPSDRDMLLGRFKDSSKIRWGHKEIAAAISANLMNGMTDDILGSDGMATRAQTAVILKRFLKAVQFID
ncbi:S-layer homology domain-containing protein [Paenibacillus hamazuiensis]|uniref:S-layer homology domain-containing protein n=1 Tax=Paenibacillus hamazuiensis TaxID=2936508 RepID=UPI00200DB773|nr:S-layer homology domain-containing protein [Paenibacillus hamazuiensis]